MARKRQTEQWAEYRRQRDEEERRQRVMVITEFDAGDLEGTLHAMADAILEYRRALRMLPKAIGWPVASAPVALIGRGPYWRRTGSPDTPDALPPAARAAAAPCSPQAPA